MLRKSDLERLYVRERKSMQDIASKIGCSVHKVTYWMSRYQIRRRSISEAVYLKLNPDGDPFHHTPPKTVSAAILYGMGLGLYWGEGNKASKTAVRLGNTDPQLLRTFLLFLDRFFHIRRERLRFGLQIFTDIDKKAALRYWVKALGVRRSQFAKPVVTISGSLGTYRKKSQHGVVTLYFSSTKLCNTLKDLLPT